MLPNDADPATFELETGELAVCSFVNSPVEEETENGICRLALEAAEGSSARNFGRQQQSKSPRFTRDRGTTTE